MIKTLILVIFFIGIAFVMFAIKILLKKSGKFPDIHIEDNKHLKKYGIKCASHDDYECGVKRKSTSCSTCNLTCSNQ